MSLHINSVLLFLLYICSRWRCCKYVKTGTYNGGFLRWGGTPKSSKSHFRIETYCFKVFKQLSWRAGTGDRVRQRESLGGESSVAWLCLREKSCDFHHQASGEHLKIRISGSKIIQNRSLGPSKSRGIEFFFKSPHGLVVISPCGISSLCWEFGSHPTLGISREMHEGNSLVAREWRDQGLQK